MHFITVLFLLYCWVSFEFFGSTCV